MKALYQTKPGEHMKLLPDGRAVVAHPHELPKVVTTDGRVETLTRDNHPDLWAVFEETILEIVADARRKSAH